VTESAAAVGVSRPLLEDVVAGIAKKEGAETRPATSEFAAELPGTLTTSVTDVNDDIDSTAADRGAVVTFVVCAHAVMQTHQLNTMGR
jgi:hypothetical protein